MARKFGARIVEIPVTTTYHPESTFNVRKHLPLFLHDIFQIRFNDLRGALSEAGYHGAVRRIRPLRSTYTPMPCRPDSSS